MDKETIQAFLDAAVRCQQINGSVPITNGELVRLCASSLHLTTRLATLEALVGEVAQERCVYEDGMACVCLPCRARAALQARKENADE